jgi:hypothetical protein
MASIKKLLKNKSYLRSCLFYINSKIDDYERKEKEPYDISLEKNMTIDDNFRVITQKDIEKYEANCNEDFIDADIERFGDDFDPDQIYYYEDYIRGVIDFVGKKYNLKTVTELHFLHKAINNNTTFKTSKKKYMYSNSYFHYVIVGFVIDEHVAEFVLTKGNFHGENMNTIIISYDKTVVLNMKESDFYDTYCKTEGDDDD